MKKMAKQNMSFAGGVTALSSATIVSQAISFIITPVTARLFAPESFGLLATFISVSSIVSVVACFRYEAAIMLPRQDADAANIFGLSAIFMFFIVILTGFLFFICDDLFLDLLEIPKSNNNFWLLPVNILSIGFFTIINYWFTRQANYLHLCWSKIAGSVLSGLVIVCGGLMGFTSGGNLVLLNVFGTIALSCIMLWLLDIKFIIRHLKYRRMKDMAKRYLKFPVFDIWSAILNTASRQLPVLLLAFFFEEKIVGLYSRSFTLLFMPVSLVGGAIGQVFFQRTSAKYVDKESLDEIVGNVFNRLVSLGILPFAILIFIAPELFEILLGAKWIEAGFYAQILAPWLFGFLIVSPLSTLFLILERQGIFLLFNIIIFLGRTGAILFGGYFYNDPELSVVLFSSIGFLFCIIECIYLFRVVNYSLKKALYVFLRYLAFAVPSLAVIAVFKWWIAVEKWYLLIVSAHASLLYVFFLLKEDLYLRNKMINLYKYINRRIFENNKQLIK